MQSILDFDFAVFRWVETCLWCPALDTLMTWITRLGDGGIVWIVLAALLLFSKKTRKYGIIAMLGLLFSLILNDNILKPLFARPRPFDLDAWKGLFVYPGLIEKPHGFSFPSGHTSSSFAAAVALVFSGKKRLYIPALVLAALVAFSRIYVHVHYCTDVLAGVVSGIACALLAAALFKGIERFLRHRNESKKPAGNT